MKVAYADYSCEATENAGEVLCVGAWCESRKLQSPEFLFWNTVLSMELVIFMLIRSFREANFSFYYAWTEEPSRGLRPLKRNSEMKYPSCSLRLNNNNILDLHDLQKTVSYFLAEPSQLAWLDLSSVAVLRGGTGWQLPPQKNTLPPQLAALF
ncbi:hypothetical protein NQZ68_031675 [Dissostichus eleginoides]|nr:hypothetical protein NQZ68_031675 [Dissostichus eleginoides]